ncbi:5-oxoprolinase subunit PxpB [Paenibacillus sp. JCM 10914]|uniref:5-oxoprolinase subunit PxpB n=1 Tax=Paenibacillus sp. JCM 10914 TaxID=1236974 RepID=UPI0003CC6477|nr:5-oxoprolinase subunit PxpB [Paenibacillus sp. JCM 10914]GAE05123.1 allophanate hydrolase 2 subunit 1 [Paenibacillus sp. JCM 10914]
MHKSYSFYPLGDSAVLVQLAEKVSLSVHRQIIRLVRQLAQYPFPGFIECIPSYTTVAVYYDLEQVGPAEGFDTRYAYICSLLEPLLEQDDSEKMMPGNSAEIIDVPVCYGQEFGPDLGYVADWNKLSVEDVIRIHTEQDYLIYAIGFAPGFPYMGGMSELIATPRKETPRLQVASGSVGIAGTQTGIYPIETPGGWQIIGRTPLSLFRTDHRPPTLLQGGQYIRFRSIGRAEYERLKDVSR